eukprot:scaffold255465_cov16-Prasinocladus_malaysianus.AAC.1
MQSSFLLAAVPMQADILSPTELLSSEPALSLPKDGAAMAVESDAQVQAGPKESYGATYTCYEKIAVNVGCNQSWSPCVSSLWCSSLALKRFTYL